MYFSTYFDLSLFETYRQLSEAADCGLLEKRSIQFLITGEEDEMHECVQVPKRSINLLIILRNNNFSIFTAHQ